MKNKVNNKLHNLLEDLTAEELEELIEIAEQKINEKKDEKVVKLIGVYDGIIALKYFKLEDKAEAIAYAHENFDSQLEKSGKIGILNSNISLEICPVPKSDVDNYLGMSNN